MMDTYILGKDGKTPELVEDVVNWSKWMNTYKRTLAKKEKNGVLVSTVFLALDCSWSTDGQPILFETMVFNGDFDGEMERYSTYDEALAGHKIMCKKVFSKKREAKNAR